MSFVKLKNKFFIENYVYKKTVVAYGRISPYNGLPYASYDDITLDDATTAQVLGVIPVDYQSKFWVRLLQVNNYLGPHIDHGNKATINFYLKADNCKTQFYKFKVEEENPAKILYPIWVADEDISELVATSADKGSYSGGDVDSSLLSKTESFVTTDNEAYCLDVSKPHSVIPLNYSLTKPSAVRRIVVTLATTLPYNLVCNLLRQTNSID